MLIRIAGIEPESYVDGEGIRFTIFLQGCLRNCPGCQNPGTHNPDGGRAVDTAEIVSAFKRDFLLTGITLSGGEPLMQPEAALELAKAAKNSGLNVWCYTGYDYEKIPGNCAELLKNIDVLVDGAYIENLRDLDLQFRGSRNQRIIDLNKTRETGEIVLWRES